MKYLILLGGLVFVIARFVVAKINKASQNSLINSIKKDPSKANDYVDALDVPYQRLENYTFDGFELIKNKIISSPRIGDYQILHTVPINPNQLLVFTKIVFTDFDVTVTGRGGDIQKESFNDFLLKFDKEKAELNIWSNLYADTTSKFQKTEFFNSLLKEAVA